MFISRFACGLVLLSSGLFASASPAVVLLPKNNAAVKKAGHLDSLHMAARELKHAHNAVNGNVKKGGNAGQHLTTAIGHIENAIQTHKANTANQARPGLAGAVAAAAHQHHHNQLHEALHAAKEAEKHLATGNVALASVEIGKAHHHVEQAIKHHEAFIGK